MSQTVEVRGKLAVIFDAFENEACVIEQERTFNRIGREIFCNAVCHMQGLYVRTKGMGRLSSIPEEGFPDLPCEGRFQAVYYKGVPLMDVRRAR